MAARLDHLLVPARDRVAAAERLASILGVPWARSGSAGPFSPVYVSDDLTLDFDEWTEPIPTLHFCFRVDDAEFDAILDRLRGAGIRIRSGPHGPDDDRIGFHRGGRIAYWGEPDGHVWEILTVSYERRSG
ncbi:VOC family protein [Myxococcota bacterium]|nr:VOC family protein [Myxococcota bacterium]